MLFLDLRGFVLPGPVVGFTKEIRDNREACRDFFCRPVILTALLDQHSHGGSVKGFSLSSSAFLRMNSANWRTDFSFLFMTCQIGPDLEILAVSSVVSVEQLVNVFIGDDHDLHVHVDRVRLKARGREEIKRVIGLISSFWSSRPA